MQQEQKVKPKIKLAQIRKRLNLTQEEVASRLGVARTNLSSFEKGKMTFDWIVKAVRLNDLLKEAGLTLDDLDLPPYD